MSTGEALGRYVDAWCAHDAARIAAAVSPDVVVTESYGPVYRGRERVRQWAMSWFERGGVVHRWSITDAFSIADRTAAQWEFEYTWRGRRRLLEGASIATCAKGLVVELTEYALTAPPYEWTGEWR